MTGPASPIEDVRAADRSGQGRRAARALIALGLLAGALAGCASGGSSDGEGATPSVTSLNTAAPPTNINVVPEELVGKWGLASYREDKDIPRTTREAKAACGNPYFISKGPGGGVMMHLADQTQPTEVVLKGAGGRTFIGPPSEPPGGVKDREVTSFAGNEFVTKWVDPGVATRYGTMIFVRCTA
jgi:hypothetical protein